MQMHCEASRLSALHQILQGRTNQYRLLSERVACIEDT